MLNPGANSNKNWRQQTCQDNTCYLFRTVSYAHVYVHCHSPNSLSYRCMPYRKRVASNTCLFREQPTSPMHFMAKRQTAFLFMLQKMGTLTENTN